MKNSRENITQTVHNAAVTAYTHRKQIDVREELVLIGSPSQDHCFVQKLRNLYPEIANDLDHPKSSFHDKIFSARGCILRLAAMIYNHPYNLKP